MITECGVRVVVRACHAECSVLVRLARDVLVRLARDALVERGGSVVRIDG